MDRDDQEIHCALVPTSEGSENNVEIFHDGCKRTAALELQWSSPGSALAKMPW